MKDTAIDRRAFLRFSAAGATMTFGPWVKSSGARQRMDNTAGANPIVDMATGKLRGYVAEGIYVFKGIPYGASTAGANRFMRPNKPEPWSGVRDALHLAPQCPQPTDTNFSGADPDFAYFLQGAFEPQPYTMSEQCLALNVWSPSLGRDVKLPVMVWCHGGACEMGSGGAAWCDGAHLAGKGAVIVTLNHRLNVFGYLHLADIGGKKYAESGNAGMLDIVAALEWVRDNIAEFGGNPDNVTLFGCSGGGWKVSTLMAMPAAKGLFSKAIVQSGPGLRMVPREHATRTAMNLMNALGLRAGQCDELRDQPAGKLLAAMQSIRETLMPGRGFAPVVEGQVLPLHPFDPNAPEISAEVPLLIGTNRDETRLLLGGADPRLFSLDDAQMRIALQQFLGMGVEEVGRIIDVYRKINYSATPSDLYFAVTTDKLARLDSIKQAERKAKQGKSPAYMYLFAWKAPTFGGKYQATHGVEIPFVFANLDKAAGFGGCDAERLDLANKISDAWIAFARHGSPNHRGLPRWNPYTLDTRATMIFDTECQIENDPGREARLILNKSSSSHAS